MKIRFSLLLLFCICLSANAQVAQDDALAFRVKGEAFDNSKVRELSEFMTDKLGSRLAASQMKLRAEGLVVEKLAEMGLSNPRVEKATDFDQGGWDNEKAYAAMTAPYYCAFAVNPKAWSGSTDGLVKGECVILNATKSEDLEKYKGQLAGKVVLMPSMQTPQLDFKPLASRYTDEELEAMKLDNRARVDRNGGPGRMPADFQEFMARRRFMTELTAMVTAEKPLCIVEGRGSYNIPSSTGAQYKAGDPEPVAQIVLPVEDHARMCRLIASGEKVEMEMEIRNKFTDNRQINNVVAEIPGTDKQLKDEVVLIGAHLDSWHGSTGAADNASGCIVMMEAMRIIKALGIQPKRTIRIALWGGEEQGLYGSRGYMENYLYNRKGNQKLPGYDKFALYLNMDNGSGRFRGIYLEQNDLAFPYFQAWMKPIESLGFTTLSPRSTGGTDHMTFNAIGLPAFQFIQDELEYERTYHTVMDTYERLSLKDLSIDAAIVAWLVICAADDPGRIPAKPGYPRAMPERRFF